MHGTRVTNHGSNGFASKLMLLGIAKRVLDLEPNAMKNAVRAKKKASPSQTSIKHSPQDGPKAARTKPRLPVPDIHQKCRPRWSKHGPTNDPKDGRTVALLKPKMVRGMVPKWSKNGHPKSNKNLHPNITKIGPKMVPKQASIISGTRIKVRPHAPPPPEAPVPSIPKTSKAEPGIKIMR